jgi:hypothetical protein
MRGGYQFYKREGEGCQKIVILLGFSAFSVILTPKARAYFWHTFGILLAYFRHTLKKLAETREKKVRKLVVKRV